MSSPLSRLRRNASSSVRNRSSQNPWISVHRRPRSVMFRQRPVLAIGVVVVTLECLVARVTPECGNAAARGTDAMAIEIVDAERVGMSTERVGWARDLVANHVATGRSPSAVAVVQRRGEVVLAEAFGVRGPHGAPLDIDDVWPIASAGKPITAAVAMTLVEEGRIGINEPVVDLRPRAGPPRATTTSSSTTSSPTRPDGSRRSRSRRLFDVPALRADDRAATGSRLRHPSVLVDGARSDPGRRRPGVEMQYDNYALRTARRDRPPRDRRHVRRRAALEDSSSRSA